MKRILIGIGAVLGVALLALLIVPFLIPESVYKSRIEEAASKALGRSVQLNGEASISVFPRIGASVADVVVDNPDGFTDDHFVTAEALRASVKWLPLFSQKIDVSTLEFVGADVSLERRADGVANWEIPASITPAPETSSESPSDLQAAIDRARLVRSSVKYVDAVSNIRREVTDINITASLQSLDERATVRGDATLDGLITNFDIDVGSINGLIEGVETASKVSLSSDLFDVSFDGTLTNSEEPALSGRFSAALDDLDSLLAFADIEVSEFETLNPLVGSVSVSGMVNGTPSALALTELELRQSSDLANVQYDGRVDLTDQPSVDGSFDITADNLPDLMEVAALEIEGTPDLASVLGSLSAAGQVSGRLDALSLTELTAKHDSPEFKFEFSGDVGLAGAPSVSGEVSANSEQVRALAAALGTDLSDRANGTFERFAINAVFTSDGTTSSTDDLAIQFDDMRLSGPVSLDLSGNVPQITADIETNALDLTPYAGATAEDGSATNTSDGWSEEPLDLSVLKSVNGTVNLTSPSIRSDDLSLTDVRVENTLSNGTMTMNIVSLKSFDGTITGDVRLVGNAAPQPTTLVANLDANGISSSKLLGTFAGVDLLSGTGALELTNLRSSGASVDELMKNLNGQMSTNLSDGTIKGINIAQIYRTATDALASGTIPSQWSPEGETDFSSFSVDTNITNGVAEIDPMRLLSPLVQMEALGTVDIGNRKLNLKPKLSNDNGDDIQVNIAGASFSVSSLPLAIGGSWTSVSGGVDTSYLQQLARDRLADSVRSELGNALGDDVGAVVGGLLGNSSQRTDADDTEEENDQPSTEDVATEVLKGIFGNNR